MKSFKVICTGQPKQNPEKSQLVKVLEAEKSNDALININSSVPAHTFSPSPT